MTQPFLRRLLIALAIPVFLFLTSASAQDTVRLWSRPNILKTNPLAPISLFYERALTRRFALQVSGRWLAGNFVFFDETFVNATIEGKIFTAKSRRLSSRSHPTGLFVNPYLKGRSLWYTKKIGTGPGNPMALDEIQVQSLGFGLTIGYQWVSSKGFVVDTFYGAGTMPPGLTRLRHTMRYSTVTSDEDRGLLMVDWRIGVSLGYAF